MTKISKQDTFRLVGKLISLLEKILYASNKPKGNLLNGADTFAAVTEVMQEVAQSDASPIVSKTVSSPAQTDAYAEIIQNRSIKLTV